MDFVERQLLKKLSDLKFDPLRPILSQAGEIFVPVPGTSDLVAASSWKGRLYGRYYALKGDRVSELVESRIRAVWAAATEFRQWEGVELPFRERLAYELNPPALIPDNPSLGTLKTCRRVAQEAYEANPFPNSLLRTLGDSIEGNLAGSRERLETEFRPVDLELENFEAYLNASPDVRAMASPGALSHQCRWIRQGVEQHKLWQAAICRIQDARARQQKMGEAAEECAGKILSLEVGERYIFAGEYGVRATAIGIARYALKQASKDNIPDWLKPFMQNGTVPDPQALAEGIVYKIIQHSLDQVAKMVGLVLEDLNIDRSAAAHVSLSDPGDYVEGLLSRAFQSLAELSDRLQPSQQFIDDLHSLFPDESRKMPDLMARVIPARMEAQVTEAVEGLLQAGLLKDLSVLLAPGAIKSLLGLVVRSAYLLERKESRREFLAGLERQLAEHIQTSLNSGLGFLDGQLDDLVASAAEILPPFLLSWADLDRIGFGAPCWLEFEKRADSYCDLVIYPTGIALNHPWHERDPKTGVAKWPLRITSVSTKLLDKEFFYGLLFHTFEPQCDSQVTPNATEFYELLHRLGAPSASTAAVLDRRRNTTDYLVQAMLTKPSIPPEALEFRRHLEAILSTCRDVWKDERRAIEIQDLPLAEALLRAVKQLNSEGKKLLKKKLITAKESIQVAETKREIEVAVEECRKRTIVQAGVLESVRAKVLYLEQTGVHSLREARDWLSWALGDEVGGLIDALATAIPSSEGVADIPQKSSRGGLRGFFARKDAWSVVAALSHCLTILESLRSRWAPVHATKFIHQSLDRHSPKLVKDLYHALLRVVSQKLSDLVVYLILRSLSSRVDMGKFKRYAAVTRGAVNRLTEEVKGERIIKMDCAPPLLGSLPKIVLGGPLLLQKPSHVEPTVTKPYLRSAILDPIEGPTSLLMVLGVWEAEDRATPAESDEASIYQRTLNRITSLPLPIVGKDSIYDDLGDGLGEALRAISCLGRSLHNTYVPSKYGKDDYVLAQYTVLFIVERLVRQCEGELLTGWQVNVSNFVRFAKGAMTGKSPLLEERLHRLLSYGFPNLDLLDLPSEAIIRRWADESLFSRRGVQPTTLTRYIDWYLQESKCNEVFRRQLVSGLSRDLVERWDQNPQCWVRYLKRQVNDSYYACAGFSLAFRLLRYHSLCAHYAVSGTKWEPQEIPENWHEMIIEESDQHDSSTLQKMWNCLKAARDKGSVQPETEVDALCPEHGGLADWLDPQVFRLSIARQNESGILSEGPSLEVEESLSNPVLSEFEAIFCEPRNQLQRSLVFLSRHPRGVWQENPQRMTDFLYAMLFQRGRLQQELQEAPDLPHVMGKVMGGLIKYYFEVDPSICISLISIAIHLKHACDGSADFPEVKDWIEQLRQLDRPQYRSAARQLRALSYPLANPLDEALIELCCSIIQDGGMDEKEPFQRLEQLFLERFRSWLPALIERLHDAAFRTQVCLAVTNQFGLHLQGPEEVAWSELEPLKLYWEGYELDLFHRTLLRNKVSVSHTFEWAKEQGRKIGVPVDALRLLPQGGYGANEFQMLIIASREVQFFRKHEGKWFKYVQTAQYPAGDVGRQFDGCTLWLQASHSEQRQLLVVKSSEEEPQTWLVKLDNNNAANLKVVARVFSDGSRLVPVAVDQWLPSLSPLLGCCALSQITCYSDEVGTHLKRIVVDIGLVPLIFEVKERDGTLRAYGKGDELEGFWIAQDQYHACLEGLGGYLLLESAYSKKVLLTAGQWVTAGLWKGLSKLEVAPFLRRWATDASIQSQPLTGNRIYSFDLIGDRLVSDDPMSQIYLLFLYLELGRNTLAEEVGESLERLCYESEKPLSQEFIEGLFPLALIPQKLNKRAAGLRYRLFAALEIHHTRVHQEKIALSQNPALSKIYYFLLITSLFTDLLHLANRYDKVRQIEEEKEYFLFQRLLRLVKELQMIQSGGLSESLLDWGTDIFQGIFLSSGKGPEIFQRYQMLRKKFGIEDSLTKKFSDKAARIWEAPTSQMDSVTVNLGKELFDPMKSTKELAQTSFEAYCLTSRIEADLDLNGLARRMESTVCEDIPLTSDELTREIFVRWFLSYYSMAYKNQLRAESIILPGGFGDPQTRLLANYLYGVSSSWAASALSLIGGIPTPGQLQAALVGDEAVSDERVKLHQKVEALRQFFGKLDRALKHTKVASGAIRTGASWIAAMAINAYSGTGLGAVTTNVGKLIEKSTGALFHPTIEGTIVPLEDTRVLQLPKNIRTTFMHDDRYFNRQLDRFFQLTFKRIDDDNLVELANGIESCNELYIALNPFQQELQGRLEQEKKELLDFIHDYPRRRGEGITFMELCHLMAKGELSSLQSLLPTLSSEEIQTIEVALLRYLLRYSRLLQLQRILAHTTSMLKEPSRISIEKLLFELQARRAYDPDHITLPLLRVLALFEVIKDTLIWPKQFRRIEKTLAMMDTASERDQVGVLLEALPGTGKTFVTGPLTMKIGSTGQRLLCMASPSQFAAANVNRLGALHRRVWNQEFHVVTFLRRSFLTPDQLAALDVLFRSIQTHGQILHMTQASAQSLYLVTISLLEKTWQQSMFSWVDQKEEQLFAGLQKLQLRLKKAELHGEEAHEQFNFLQQLCYPEGAFKRISDDHASAAGQVVQLLNEALQGISVEKLRYLNEEDYRTNYLPAIAKKCSDLPCWGALTKEQRQQLYFFLTAQLQLAPEWMKRNTANYSKICMLSLVISIYLPKCACERLVDTEFSIGTGHSAVPNLGNKMHDPNSDIKDAIERLVKTFLVYYANGLSKQQLEELVQDLKKQARQETERGVSPHQQTASQRWSHLLPEMDPLNIFCLDTLPLPKLEQLQRHPGLIDYYVRRYAVPEIRYYPQSSFADPYTWASMFGTQLHSTGTLYNGALCDPRLEILRDPETAMLTQKILESKITSIKPLTALNPSQILYEELNEYFKPGSPYTTIIDGASLFTGISSIEVARIMLEHAHNRPDIHAVVFCSNNNNGEDQWMFISKENPIPVPLSRCHCKPDQMYTYFDGPHCYSSDVSIEGHAVVNIDKHTKYFEFIQWLLRVRGVNNWKKVLLELGASDGEQKAGIVAPAKDFTAIFENTVSIEALRAHIIEEEKSYLLKLSLPSYQLQLLDILRRSVRDEFLQARGLREASKIFGRHRALYITNMTFDPIELRNRQQINQPSSVVVEALRERAIRAVTESYFSPSEQNLLIKTIEELPVPEMPPQTLVYKTTQGEFILESIGETMKMTEEQQLDVQQEEQVQTESVLERIPPYNEMAWPESVGPFNEEKWLVFAPDPSQPPIASQSLFGRLTRVIGRRISLEKDEPQAKGPPLYTLASVLTCMAPVNLGEISAAFDSRIWLTNNWLPTSVGVQVGTKAQRPLQDVLIRFDADNKVVWIGCLSEKDSAFWVNKLSKSSDSQISVYNMSLRQIRAGKQISRAWLKNNEDFVLLETQLLFLSGANFTPKQQQQLKNWMEKHDPAAMKEVYMNIFHSRNEGQFSDSVVSYMFL